MLPFAYLSDAADGPPSARCVCFCTGPHYLHTVSILTLFSSFIDALQIKARISGGLSSFLVHRTPHIQRRRAKRCLPATCISSLHRHCRSNSSRNAAKMKRAPAATKCAHTGEPVARSPETMRILRCRSFMNTPFEAGRAGLAPRIHLHHLLRAVAMTVRRLRPHCSTPKYAHGCAHLPSGYAYMQVRCAANLSAALLP